MNQDVQVLLEFNIKTVSPNYFIDYNKIYDTIHFLLKINESFLTE